MDHPGPRHGFRVQGSESNFRSAFHIGDARSVVFLTSASKFHIEPNGGIFDFSPENHRASPNEKPLEDLKHLEMHVDLPLSLRTK